MIHWKDFKIPALQGTEISEKNGEEIHAKPTKIQYTRRRVAVTKCLDAMNLTWMITVALGMWFEGGIFVQLIVDYKQDDFESFVFKYIVVQLALDAGVKHLPFFDSPFGFGNVEPNYEAIVEQVPAAPVGNLGHRI